VLVCRLLLTVCHWLQCSRECQASDWSRHKFLCSTAAAPPPIDSKVRAESATPAEALKPLDSGIRVLPDGGYESFIDGKKLGEDGFPVRTRPIDTKPKRVITCTDCSGNGVRKETIDGIIRTEYCQFCRGDGCIVHEEEKGEKGNRVEID